MPRTTQGRFIKKAAQLVSSAKSHAGRALGIKPKTPANSIAWHLRDLQVRKALQVILTTLNDRHRERLMEDIQTTQLSLLSRYVLYIAFLETVSPPVRPLALHPELGDWLLALPDDHDRYYPADPCWDCGYRYPGTSRFASSAPSRYPARRLCASSPPPASPPDPHPWVSRKCLYCGGEIVNHVEWLDPSATRTLSEFQNAPYRTKQQSMASEWRRDLDLVKPFVVPPSGARL
jgi:hypothetical protein